jgi:mannitol-1-phosphate 5-dehydrogenase
MKKLVQFGAGSIGRSFIGQLFGRAGYEVVFVDIDAGLVESLNARREYHVEIRDEIPDRLTIRNVRAVVARDIRAVVDEIASADILGTAVGKNALAELVPLLVLGLRRRLKAGRPPIDIIICENILAGAAFLRNRLEAALPKDFPREAMPGLVETSIGKMVPIMPEEARRNDPLLVYAEAYNSLIVDRRGFKSQVPDVHGLEPKDNMRAYVERKSFIHNLGHAMTAYLSSAEDRGHTYTWEAMADEDIRHRVRRAMVESGQALARAYPKEFNKSGLEAHIDDLLKRFGNIYLGDTIHRVGRDVRRKLARDDRLIGAMRFQLSRGVTPHQTAEGAAAACFFHEPDADGHLYADDEIFIRTVLPRGIDTILETVCSLSPDDVLDKRVMDLIRPQFRRFSKFWDVRESERRPADD